MLPIDEIRVNETSERKATTVPEAEGGLSRRSADRKNAKEISAKSLDWRRFQPDFTGSGGALAIDMNWQLLRPDDGKIYPHRIKFQIHQSPRRRIGWRSPRREPDGIQLSRWSISTYAGSSMTWPAA